MAEIKIIKKYEIEQQKADGKREQSLMDNILQINQRVIEKMLKEDGLTKEELEEMMLVYKAYNRNFHEYKKVGEKFVYENVLYEVRQAHTSEPTYNPSELLALYIDVMPEGVVPKWQPGRGYNTGQRVSHIGFIWESTFNGNTAEPDHDSGHYRFWKIIKET